MKKIIIFIMTAGVIAGTAFVYHNIKSNNAPSMIEMITTADSDETIDIEIQSEIIIETDDTLPNDDIVNAEGKVLRIKAWDEEFKYFIENYCLDLIPDDVSLEWSWFDANESLLSVYQEGLYTELAENDSGFDSNPIDIFFIEPYYALKYTNSEYTLNLKELGITDDDLINCYPYTIDLGTNDYGEFKSITWQASPVVFTYRRSIAENAFGSDDPEYVQSLVSDWESFDKTAEQLFDKGYRMVSGYDDLFRVHSKRTIPWVDANKKIQIDDNLFNWVDRATHYTLNEYNNNTGMWSTEWFDDVNDSSNVFGYFFAPWAIDFMLPLSNTIGDWAVCEGPETNYWGGTMVCVNKNTDNQTLACDVIRRILTDTDNLHSLADNGYLANNMAVMSEYAKTSTSDLLGGQHHNQVYHNAAMKIDVKKATPYDMDLDINFISAFTSYLSGHDDKETALNNFYDYSTEMYPELNYK